MRVLMILVPAAVLAAGCGRSDDVGPVKVYPVTGQVLCDGKPAAGVEVTFLPSDAPTAPQVPRAPSAVTGADGRFALGTFADADGAAEGGYLVVMRWPKTAPAPDGDAEGEVDSSEDDRLLGWYDATHSGQTFRVKPGANELTLKVVRHTQRPGQSQGVPGRN